VQHLDLRHIGRGLKPSQPHAAAFHPHQAIVAAAIGTHVVGKCRSRDFSCLCFDGFVLRYVSNVWFGVVWESFDCGISQVCCDWL